jgi:glycosyltransferase involved in cell wall biosynthesis
VLHDKKRLLFVSSRFPYPLNGGFEIKNYHLLRVLSQVYDVDAHFIQYGKISSDALNSITPFCKSIFLHRPNFFEVLIRLIRNFFNGDPLQCALYESYDARVSIENSLRSADAAICSVIRTSQYLNNKKIPNYFDLADSLGQVYKHNKSRVNWLLKFIYKIEYPRLLRLENSLVKSSSGVFFFNLDEAKLYTNDNVHVVTHGVDSSLLSRNFSNARDVYALTFIGKMSVIHNVDMVKWFVKNVLPLIPEEINLHVIGSNPSADLVALALRHPRLLLRGYVEDPYPLMHSSLACICPLQIGGGIQNKIIESLAIGAVVMASARAASPFSEIIGSGLLVCDSPLDWVEAIMRGYNDVNYYNNFRKVGRLYAEDKFSWDEYGSQILGHLSH